ncbi:hypothetical protein BGLT_01008 [Caballeronia glathei]|jgi:osmotically-inducible protein OsmY|uniref:Transporter n=1 Tax=Caballeronia glathei TaxID=60547 RepID=A0A069PM17_9BURK|nr:MULTISPECIES: BON domain-containing protein [Burkholderiaceae]KDR41713.1 transporter [Caballeronia glathei]TCK36332.1 BON domain-containing protein [Paraburkholderia sp. BL8N3]CDY78135.1 hypothetical protein BGLT_01008 [Caballeronia glathei]
MKSMKTYVAAAIAIGAIVSTVPVVGAQETAGTSATATPSSARAANRQLAKRVQSTLYKQKGLDSTDIHAIARGGKITLVGMAHDQSQIDMAAKLAGSVSGVTSVTNNLTVEEPGH